MSYLSPGHFIRKCKGIHVLNPKLPVASWDPSHESLISQSSARYLLVLFLPIESHQENLLEQTYRVLSYFHSNPDYLVSVLMEQCWQQRLCQLQCVGLE